ncbi:MAG: 23S rRNA (uracil(1939)-C(5))-methyltransferase RlmD [Chloroflexi bacterium]|nr:23S rRNA (uracil(1939)-C(5))-methyltransferase RlmD [Chloroflexota bacterium]
MQDRTPKKTATDQEELARLTLEEMAPLGDTYAHYEDQTINVFGGIPGEEVVVRIVRYKSRRQQRVSGIVVEVLTPSPHRVEPPCPYFGPCTGCQWQHIDYEYQLELKRNAVLAHLSAYPELERVSVAPTLPSPQQFNYRNHARFTVRDGGKLGFVNRINRRFVKIGECMLMTPWINETLGTLQGKSAETSQLTIRYGINTGDWLVQPILHNEEVPIASGQGHYKERLLDRPFRIASPSFFQVNTKQAERLAELVRDRLELNGTELVVDAYAGVGTFAVLLAPFVRSVVAIEESSAALKDAAINTLGIGNLDFIEGRTEDVLDELVDDPDAVVLDPPRVGCHPKALQALVRRSPRRVVYVSCEPETLARDLSLLVQGGFRVERLEPVDMFPQTYHVECVATLARKALV